MPTYINTNINSLNVQMAMNASQSQQSTAMQRLATGLRINSAADDAAGFAISTRMTSQIGGDTQAARNANDGVSLAQTAGGDLTQITNNLQTMRDLAVQSANATNSASDRAALNNQLQALSAEIQRVSQTSAFNGVNLLDGTFATQVFQVGANSGANNQIQISSIASASTSSLGAASLTSQSTVAGTATTAALAAGDLTLNGAQVGASVASTAPGQTADSASSIATAINNVSGTSGVTATANAAVVTGSGATVFTAIAAGTFSINGVSVGAVAAGGNAQGQGANTAAAINQISAQTGVTATADATTGALTLTAADGRDIQIGLNGTAVDAATAAANKTTFLSQTGFVTGNVGTQAASAGTTAQAVGTNVPNLAYITSIGLSGSVNNLTVSYNGGAFVAITPFADIGNYGIDGINFQNAINAALGFGATSYAGGAVQNVSTNNLTFAIGGTAPDLATANANKTALLAATGLTSAQLGTQAYLNSPIAAVAADNSGTVSLTSTNAAGIVIGGANAANAGLTIGTTAPSTTSTVNSVANINISTAAGATAALAVIDGALSQVATSQAALGAIQNRFTSVVTSLQTTSTNLTAAQSRIQDTDYAATTAQLSRTQILQQTGNAMLAQANQLPNQVMTLLR